ncbi:GATA transcription factor 11-like [Rutidosis leptorrhynchoides]|uniref:GATA transcription factor 11-like n=1 Tax=Rutidosis leptorrhynchoides TaxID=125765 RepID=UPI003A99E47F
MDSKDNRMCTNDAYGHGFYDDDDDAIPDISDFPDKNIEEDGLNEDWSKLGPIPAEVFDDVLLPVVGRGDGVGSTNLSTCFNDGTKLQPVYDEETFKSKLKQQLPTTFLDEKKLYRIPIFFEAPSPDSVLERGSSSSSNEKTTPVIFRTGVSIPVKSRSKRSRPSPVSGSNAWSKSPILIPTQKVKKKRRVLSPQQPVNGTKKCSHCEITKTPQWREGPMGPKTLCNACGVRYRSGRLFPEYRPAASPTFIPSLHSNSHRKVIQMRQKGGAGIDNDSYVVKKPPSSNST